MEDLTASVQAITDRLVKNLLEKKTDGTLTEVLKELMPSLKNFAVHMHPPGCPPELIHEAVEESFEQIPGSYRLSMFLSCLTKTGELISRDVKLDKVGKVRRDGIFPPIVLQKDGMKALDAYKITGKALKDKYGRYENEVSDREAGKNVYEDWESRSIDVLFLKPERPRPVISSILRNEKFWKRKGFVIVKPTIDKRWFGEEDISFQDGILFPLHLLSEKDDPIATSSNEQAMEEMEVIDEHEYSLRTDETEDSTDDEDAVMEDEDEMGEDMQAAVMNSFQTMEQEESKVHRDLNQIEVEMQHLCQSSKPGGEEGQELKQLNDAPKTESDVKDAKILSDGREPAGVEKPQGKSQDPDDIDYLEGVDESEWNYGPADRNCGFAHETENVVKTLSDGREPAGDEKPLQDIHDSQETNYLDGIDESEWDTTF